MEALAMIVLVFVFGVGVQLWFYEDRDTALGYVAAWIPGLSVISIFDYGIKALVIGIPIYWAYGMFWSMAGDPSSSRFSARHLASVSTDGKAFVTFWLALFTIPLLPVFSRQAQTSRRAPLWFHWRGIARCLLLQLALGCFASLIFWLCSSLIPAPSGYVVGLKLAAVGVFILNRYLPWQR